MWRYLVLSLCLYLSSANEVWMRCVRIDHLRSLLWEKYWVHLRYPHLRPSCDPSSLPGDTEVNGMAVSRVVVTPLASGWKTLTGPPGLRPQNTSEWQSHRCHCCGCPSTLWALMVWDTQGPLWMAVHLGRPFFFLKKLIEVSFTYHKILLIFCVQVNDI